LGGKKGARTAGAKAMATRRRARCWQCRGRRAARLRVSLGTLGEGRAKGRGATKGLRLAHVAASRPCPDPRAATRKTGRWSAWRAEGLERSAGASRRRFNPVNPISKGTNSKILNTSSESPNMKVVDDASEYNFYQG
jgi:hypothetical protein